MIGRYPRLDSNPFLSLGFILALGFCTVSLTISTGLSMLRKHWRTIRRGRGTQGVRCSTVDIHGRVAVCLYLPLPPRNARSGGGGSLVTAALFDVGRWAVGVYLAHSTQPSAFGAAASFATSLL